MKSTKKAIFQQRTLMSIQLWSSQFWNPIANVSVTLQYENTPTQKPDREIKKIIPINEATILIDTKK